MRRKRRVKNEDSDFRNLLFIAGTVLLIAVIAFGVTYAIYSNKVKNEARVSQLDSRKIGELIPSIHIEEKTEAASNPIGKSVGEIKEETSKIDTENKKENMIEEKPLSIPEEEMVLDTKTSDDKKELSFKMPVNGAIIMEYAEEKLVYSETLKEWVTHLGIDIAADKTTVVKAAERGIVKNIKNDPRYGLTVIIEHDDGFKTVYSNLLTAEFISEGEELEQGQTIGTVGTSAIFEVAEEPHLHFEIWKDEKQEDPMMYLK